jgi:asparagine synthase (glutamine-hydrolysing)
MRARFLAVIRLAGPDAGAAEQPDCAAATVEPLPVLVRGDRLTVSSNFGMAGPDTAGEAVVGELFGRGSTQPAHALTETEWTGIRQSRGLALVEGYWGAYVAFIVGDGEVSIVRAPLGDVGCYYARSGDMLIVASDLALLLAASGRARRISMPALARHIAYPEWRSGETCIDGVGELRGGDRLTVSAAGMRCETLWSPWAFVVDERMIDDSDEAARAIRNAVHLGVRARAARLDRTLLLLSGGLDSAIVAASLARIGADFVCLNLVGDDPASDEQHYAGLVADSVGARLLTRRFELERIDVRRSGAAHMPYPVHRCFTQAQDSVAMEVTNEEGAQAILDGGGGDNVFFASRTVTILADCLIAGGFDRRFWAATRALGDLGQTGMLALARKAAYRAWLAPGQDRAAPLVPAAATNSAGPREPRGAARAGPKSRGGDQRPGADAGDFTPDHPAGGRGMPARAELAVARAGPGPGRCAPCVPVRPATSDRPSTLEGDADQFRCDDLRPEPPGHPRHAARRKTRGARNPRYERGRTGA